MLCDGIAPALTDLVVEYVGEIGKQALQERPWSPDNCHSFADVARRLLTVAATMREVLGQTVSSLLPTDTPAFAKSLAMKLGERFPLAWDRKLRAVARALQVTGIFMCMVKCLPVRECECLCMLCSEVVQGAIEVRVMALVQDAEIDIRMVEAAEGSRVSWL
jgi:hypothetical protein